MKPMTMDIEKIKTILPHREPMLMVSTVTACRPMESIEGTLFVDPEWTIFDGHFPGNPVFPGVLSVESMAQMADIMIMTAEKYQGKEPLFAGISDVRFKKKIIPGANLIVKVRVADENDAKAKVTCEGKLYLEGELAAQATFTVAMR